MQSIAVLAFLFKAWADWNWWRHHMCISSPLHIAIWWPSLEIWRTTNHSICRDLDPDLNLILESLLRSKFSHIWARSKSKPRPKPRFKWTRFSSRFRSRSGAPPLPFLCPVPALLLAPLCQFFAPISNDWEDWQEVRNNSKVTDTRTVPPGIDSN